VVRLEAMEQRLAAMFQAVQALYAADLRTAKAQRIAFGIPP
jgi:hypothetical protein